MKLRRLKTPVPKGPAPMQLQAAYAVCRSISRAAARNFYYAFLALPREKRDAICAVYAFMRHADDLSDAPGLAAEERRTKLDDWLLRLRQAASGLPTDDPVLLALGDAQRRYKIPLEWLEKLVAGTAMDVESGAPQRPGSAPAASASAADAQPTVSGGVALAESSGPQTATPVAMPYETFDELYRYCYHVASVVGLVCIRIFGYRDPAAEALAEHTGIAFQLTNIIRDVKEDAAMGRIYIPREDFDRFAVSPADLPKADAQAAQRFRPVLEFEAQRARAFYLEADRLLPYIDEDSRPALWVLVTIYRRLLEKIANRNYDVFSGKVRLSFWEKFSVLARGVWQRIA